jgi:trimethylamine--corrinoid protein Co-methyltransferase
MEKGEEEGLGRVRRGRAHRVAARKEGSKQVKPYLTRKIEPYNLLSEEELEKVELYADRILWEVGLEITDHPFSLDLLRGAGAKVEGTRVRCEGAMLREIIRGSAPREFTQHARNPEKSVVIGGKNTVFVPAYGPPFVRDLEKGRRYASMEDFSNFVKLAYMSESLHHSGGTVCEPVDLPVNKRHFDMVYAHLRYSDRPFLGSVTAGERAQDTVEMAKIVFGSDFVDKNCVVVGLINANSPLGFDKTMLDALCVYAENNQGCLVSPFVVGGAMSPASVIGIVTQTYVEVMLGMALTQLVRRGSPVVFGSFASTMSMQSGAPIFGMAESSLVQMGVSQLARRLGVPCRSGGGLCTSKIADGQACYEASNTLNATLMSGVNFVLHSAGWLEGGLSMGYEKFMMDNDQLRNVARLAEGVDTSDESFAFDAFEEVGPGGHFLGSLHTRRHFETAFIGPGLSDVNSYEQWKEEGERDMLSRAHDAWKRSLLEYERPFMDEGIDEGLKDFMGRRKASMPDREY